MNPNRVDFLVEVFQLQGGGGGGGGEEEGEEEEEEEKSESFPATNLILHPYPSIFYSRKALINILVSTNPLSSLLL